MHGVVNQAMIWRVSLARIEQVVSAHLGPGRVSGNAAGPCFSRQVSMYLAKHVGHWSLPQIGKFYNGRHHTTVLHAIGKIENLRKIDESVDALIEVLTDELAAGPHDAGPRLPFEARTALVEAGPHE
jgi:chromosomal replication initiator protein